MRIAVVNPITQTSPGRWRIPFVESNHQCIAMQLGRALEKAGADVVVVAAEPYRPRIADEGVRTAYLPVGGGWLSPPSQLPHIVGLREFIESGQFDAVLSSELFQWSTLALARMASREGPPLFVWHEADRYQRLGFTLPARAYYSTAGRTVLKSATAVLPRSAAAPLFLAQVGLPSAKLGPLVPNGFDGDVFEPQHAMRHVAPRLLYSGSLIERKTPDLAIRALRLVRDSFPNATLCVKGSGSLEAELRSLTSNLGLEDAVQFDVERSTLAQMAAVYNDAWVGVFPSERDFVTLSPVEAAACGVPVVVSDRQCHASFVRQSGIGKAVPNDAASIAQAVVEIINTYGRDGLDSEAVSLVHAVYSLDRVAVRLLEFLRTALAR